MTLEVWRQILTSSMLFHSMHECHSSKILSTKLQENVKASMYLIHKSTYVLHTLGHKTEYPVRYSKCYVSFHRYTKMDIFIFYSKISSINLPLNIFFHTLLGDSCAIFDSSKTQLFTKKNFFSYDWVSHYKLRAL